MAKKRCLPGVMWATVADFLDTRSMLRMTNLSKELAIVKGYVTRLDMSSNAKRSFQSKFTDITWLSAYDWLLHLNLSSCLAVFDFTVLGHLSKLEQLNLASTKVNDLSWIIGLTRLKILNLTGCQMESHNLTILGQLISLEDLAFSVETMIVFDVSWVENLTNLQGLMIHSMNGYKSTRLTGSFSSLTKLRSLKLSRIISNDVNFPPLQHLQELNLACK